MTIKTKTLICLGALLGMAATVPQVSWPLAKLTVHVVDEQGAAVPDAEVKIGFREKLSDRNAWAVGKTDNGGNFTAEGYSDMRLAGSVRKEGYYDAGTGWTIFKESVLQKWQPWGSVAQVVLRPVGEKVALYAKSAWIEIPAIGEPCGYDLKRGDWVAPHGHGIDPDFIFTLQRRYASRDDFDVRVKLGFAQLLDGIQETALPVRFRNCAFRWTRQAPEGGYQSTLETRFARDPKAGTTQSASEEQAYFFRVRTEEKDGRMVSAFYGKVSGGLQLAPSNSKTCKVKLIYYISPNPLDRNLEWDTKHNLLEGLNYEQTPREP
jgi:hypothetical protein